MGALAQHGPSTLGFETFRKARWLARQHGVSLEELISELVEQSIAARSYRKKRPVDERADGADEARPADRERVPATGS